MSEGDLKSLFFGALGTILVAIFFAAWKRFRVMSIESDIDIINFEIEHLDKIKRSSVEMNRSSFKNIFALFLLFGFEKLIHSIFEILSLGGFLNIPRITSLVVWSAFLSVSWRCWKRYDNLRNYTKAVEKLEKQRASKEQKLQNLKVQQ